MGPPGGGGDLLRRRPANSADSARRTSTIVSAAREVLAELLELAPSGSALFSSDAYGLAEHFAVAVASFRDALGHLPDGGVADGSWSATDAERIAGMVTSGNTRRAYGLDL